MQNTCEKDTYCIHFPFEFPSCSNIAEASFWVSNVFFFFFFFFFFADSVKSKDIWWGFYKYCLCQNTQTDKDEGHAFFFFIYSEIPLLRPPKIKTFYPLKTLFANFKLFFLHFLHPVYFWLETTFETVKKWSLRPLLDSPKGGQCIYPTPQQNC